MPTIPYPQDFFAVQLTFAQKMSEVGPQAYSEAVLHDTAFYRILGLDWNLDPADPVWQTYLLGLNQREQDVEWTYRFYLSRFANILPYYKPRWGCFMYEYHADSRVIHLHFSNLDASGYGPLSTLRKEARVAELQSIFLHISEKYPEAEIVKGGSWLYNREEYTRLFPPAFGQSARSEPAQPQLLGRSLWGQFLRHNNQMNERTTALFLEHVGQLREAEKYVQCFPYQVMFTEASIERFYEFYGVM